MALSLYTLTLLLELAPILIYPYFTIYTINAPSSLYKDAASRTSSYTNISLLYTLTLLLELARTLIYPYFTIYTINAPFSLYLNATSRTSSYTKTLLL